MAGRPNPEKRLETLSQLPGNIKCADCATPDAKWISMSKTFGLFICIRCSGVHRSLGTHICRVRSVELDNWTHELVDQMEAGGNERGNAVLEANIVAPFKKPVQHSPQHEIDDYIKAKYADELFKGASAVSPRDNPSSSAPAPSRPARPVPGHMPLPPPKAKMHRRSMSAESLRHIKQNLDKTTPAARPPRPDPPPRDPPQRARAPTVGAQPVPPARPAQAEPARQRSNTAVPTVRPKPPPISSRPVLDTTRFENRQPPAAPERSPRIVLPVQYTQPVPQPQHPAPQPPSQQPPARPERPPRPNGFKPELRRYEDISRSPGKLQPVGAAFRRIPEPPSRRAENAEMASLRRRAAGLELELSQRRGGSTRRITAIREEVDEVAENFPVEPTHEEVPRPTFSASAPEPECASPRWAPDLSSVEGNHAPPENIRRSNKKDKEIDHGNSESGGHKKKKRHKRRKSKSHGVNKSKAEKKEKKRQRKEKMARDFKKTISLVDLRKLWGKEEGGFLSDSSNAPRRRMKTSDTEQDGEADVLSSSAEMLTTPNSISGGTVNNKKKKKRRHGHKKKNKEKLKAAAENGATPKLSPRLAAAASIRATLSDDGGHIDPSRYDTIRATADIDAEQELPY